MSCPAHVGQAGRQAGRQAGKLLLQQAGRPASDGHPRPLRRLRSAARHALRALVNLSASWQGGNCPYSPTFAAALRWGKTN